jgi:endo-1,4-beta-xylanase
LGHKEADEILKAHFSSLTVENAMKFGLIHPEEGLYDWDESDIVANYARNNGMSLRGHTMVWHNQNPPWLFLDGGSEVSKNKLLKRLEDHIGAVTQRYNDIVASWDVVNEAVDTDHNCENSMRNSPWYKICGKEVYELAFKWMKQASPNAKLLYNDYNNESGKKLDENIRFISSLLDAGVPIDGVGIQGHWYFNSPKKEAVRDALERYSALGLQIEFTEVDVSLYEWTEKRDKSEHFSSLPEDRVKEQSKRYMDLFSLAAEYPAVKNVTTWGIADNCTWLDNFPVKEGRKNWPLLFDVNYSAKPIVAELIEAGLKR